MKERKTKARDLFLVGLFWLLFPFLWFLAQSDDTVAYVVGARWFASDNPGFICFSGFISLCLGILGIGTIIYAILIALGIKE